MSMLPQQLQSERQRKDAQMPLVYRGRSLIKTAKKQRTMLTFLNALGGEIVDGEEGGGVDRTDGVGPPWALSDGERVKDTATMSVKRKNARWTGFHGTRNICPTKSPSCSSTSFCSEISPTSTTTTMLAFPTSSSTLFSPSSRVRRVPSVSSASPRTLPTCYRSSSSSSSSLSLCLFHILVVIVIVITSSTLIEGSNDLM